MKPLNLLYLFYLASLHSLSLSPTPQFTFDEQLSSPTLKQINFMRTQNKQKFEYIDPDYTLTEFQTQPVYVVPDYIEL